jgi:hypothetical protein
MQVGVSSVNIYSHFISLAYYSKIWYRNKIFMINKDAEI